MIVLDGIRIQDFRYGSLSCDKNLNRILPWKLQF